MDCLVMEGPGMKGEDEIDADDQSVEGLIGYTVIWTYVF